MASSAGVEAPSICDRVQRLRDVSRLILDAIERDDLAAMAQHVDESDRLIASIGHGLAANRSERTQDSQDLLDHIRRMNAGMVERLRARQDAILDEITRAKAFWHRVRHYRSNMENEPEGFDHES